jgi:hypothetical protein
MATETIDIVPEDCAGDLSLVEGFGLLAWHTPNNEVSNQLALMNSQHCLVNGPVGLSERQFPHRWHC